jgi:hypothetical protein
MTAEELCDAIHSSLARLPIWRAPRDAQFSDGVYFFYETGETNSHGTDRIVRVGTHNVGGRLRERLRKHYRADQTGSVFRKLIGEALLRRDEMETEVIHWQQCRVYRCALCTDEEGFVSRELASRFTFRCIRVMAATDRLAMESGVIASLALCTVCGPSSAWLGRYSGEHRIRDSGLWQTQHLNASPLDIAGLSAFEQLTRRV